VEVPVEVANDPGRKTKVDASSGAWAQDVDCAFDQRRYLVGGKSWDWNAPANPMRFLGFKTKKWPKSPQEIAEKRERIPRRWV
jgi:hypothetical protein